MTDRPLWRELKALVTLVATLFGEPAALWEEGAIRVAEARRLYAWLRALEGAARALLLVMARGLAADPSPAPRPSRDRRPPRGGGAPERAAGEGAPPELPPSEHWAGVSFRLLPAGRSGARGVRGGRGRTLVMSAPIARRLEALIRVAEAPERYARRLARRLREEPALRARFSTAPRGAPPAACETLLHEALAAAVAAPETG